jgi:hypothetical protein
MDFVANDEPNHEDAHQKVSQSSTKLFKWTTVTNSLSYPEQFIRLLYQESLYGRFTAALNGNLMMEWNGIEWEAEVNKPLPPYLNGIWSSHTKMHSQIRCSFSRPLSEGAADFEMCEFETFHQPFCNYDVFCNHDV